MPLIEASKKGHVHVAKEFLDHGAHIEAKDIGDGTPLELRGNCLVGRVSLGLFAYLYASK
jgi:ankyrin repeat protein